jgi:hypothetical protein
MTDHDKDQVLAVLRHYLTPDLRERVMAEAPTAYNAWVGREVVQVTFVNPDDHRVIRCGYGDDAVVA